MPLAWRLVKEKYAGIAFSGEGAAKSGGRWNSRGQAAVYASGTLSLAALETLVHLFPPVSIRYVAIRIEFDSALVEKLNLKTLPPDWRAEPPAPSTQAIGDAWISEKRSAVLEMPSIIIPSESNYLLNPLHPQFGRISIGKPETFAFDPRLVSSGSG